MAKNRPQVRALCVFKVDKKTASSPRIYCVSSYQINSECWAGGLLGLCQSVDHGLDGFHLRA
jgi:hypothetical protein